MRTSWHVSLCHPVERGYGGSRLTTDLLVPATRLLMQPIVSGCSVVPDSTGLRGIRPTGLPAFPSTPRAVHERVDQRCTSVGTVGPNRHGHGYMNLCADCDPNPKKEEAKLIDRFLPCPPS